MASSGDNLNGATSASFRPALLVVDMQEDFCPPNGTLAIQGGRTLAPVINSLLSLPGFAVKISTQDFHPTSHISFAANQPAPNNIPFQSTTTLTNPATGRETETKPQRLWPVHCVANTPGACIIPEIEADKISVNIRKGMDARMEMYSAFADAFGNNDCVETGGVNMDLAAVLREHQASDVFIVGLAGDYCVKDTAVDAVDRGFRCFVVEEGTKCIDPGKGWEAAKQEMEDHGVRIVNIDGPEVGQVRTLLPVCS
ncbi:isochorismatase family hydrolase [Blastomyces gilchristii SLH14081]|uniref:nicotinamidase n=1 Tax=Blastomyces gilchristii (strain SLH14081) TaxID=559298 RepID=A0A179UM92_BLAGS|nr:isochorismatase family hydrolase [Blastomyces gilchristii SLH14081]OAT09196.1 isochorismatase family hydrolase [Blastomyces gilchristii SLH14081]